MPSGYFLNNGVLGRKGEIKEMGNLGFIYPISYSFQGRRMSGEIWWVCVLSSPGNKPQWIDIQIHLIKGWLKHFLKSRLKIKQIPFWELIHCLQIPFQYLKMLLSPSQASTETSSRTLVLSPHFWLILHWVHCIFPKIRIHCTSLKIRRVRRMGRQMWC